MNRRKTPWTDKFGRQGSAVASTPGSAVAGTPGSAVAGTPGTGPAVREMTMAGTASGG
ncbi:hypothetical protein [Micromonospora sonneratiae]|uniref:Uncharacterized protein n=1 Tax=Micromonospora sonneratiae TaxID=1184706 RepID=A0ABW3YHS3_9ACTN